MKTLRHLIAAALCVAGTAPAFALVTNGSFTDGLNGWQTIGDVFVQGVAAVGDHRRARAPRIHLAQQHHAHQHRREPRGRGHARPAGPALGLADINTFQAPLNGPNGSNGSGRVAGGMVLVAHTRWIAQTLRGAAAAEKPGA